MEPSWQLLVSTIGMGIAGPSYSEAVSLNDLLTKEGHLGRVYSWCCHSGAAFELR